MLLSLAVLVGQLLFPGVALAFRGDTLRGYLPPVPPEIPKDIEPDAVAKLAAKSNIQLAIFQQLIDHNNPSLGTFPQRYWFNAEFYSGPGSPIILSAPGEHAGDQYTGYTTNRSLPGLFAQATGGAALVLEHRYWGGSSPFQNLTADTLQYLTLDQAINDLTHFAENVELDFDPDGTSRPDKAPWVLSGCSYAGTLSAWTAPPELKQSLKESFGLGDLYDDDFATAVPAPLGVWQNQQFYTGYSDFWRMCDYIEGQFPGSNNTVPGPEGVGPSAAIRNYAKWWRESWLPGDGACPDHGTFCYNTHDSNSEVFTNTAVDNPWGRAWLWLLCNEPTMSEWSRVWRTLSTLASSANCTSSSVNGKRASIMPGPAHSAHASGLGARTISPTDTRRMKRMSMMPPPPPPVSSSINIPLPPPVSMDTRSRSRSPSMIPRKPSLTLSSARTTPDPNRKSHNSGLSIGSTSSFTTARSSTGSTQPRVTVPPPSSRLPAPKPNTNSQNTAGPNDDDEYVPPVPAIPKVYESPKDSGPTEAYFMDKKRSALSSVETLSIHSNSTGSVSLPVLPEPVKPKRGLSTRKSTHASTASKDEKQARDSRKNLQPLTLPPLNLAPLSMPTAAKVAALQDHHVRERCSPPPARQVPKTPTTPMTASKSSFFSNRYDDTIELPPLRSSSTVHHSHRKNTTPPELSSSDSSSIMMQDPISKPSISPFISSSLPKGGFDFGGHQRSKASGEYNTVQGTLTESRTPRKSSTTKSETSKHVPKSPGPAPTPEEPPTPSSMSSLRRKLSMSWKRSASKNHGDLNDTGANSTSEAVPRLPMSATTSNLHNAKTRDPMASTASSTTTEQRVRKSSAQSLTMLPLSKSESWGLRKESGESNTMPISRIKSSTSKSLKPRSSSTTLRQGSYSANELDKDDLAANDEMRKMGSRRKETDIAARTLDALKKRASPKERVGPQEAIRIAMLNIYERGEIIDYHDIYFCGTQSARKVVGDLQSDAPNFGYDDERGDYTIVAGDHLAYRYEIVDILGKGSFGQVLRCIDHKLGKLVAIKIIRNKKRFHQQALVEVNILQKLREWDPHDKHSMVCFTQSFYFRGHLCISTELLDMNLYEFIKAHSFRGFSLKIIRRFTKQILSSLILLKQRKIIHCDLKPENILLKHPLHSELKVIDFGSSCFENEKVYTYIQSRFYRSPEVILGMTYGLPIDMWSVGCILAELYTGVPIFPGENEQEQLACIMEVFGPPEKHLIEKSTRKKLFFDSMGKPRLTVSSKGRRRRPSSKTLQQAIKCDDEAFLDFLARCLRWDPDRRLKPEDARVIPGEAEQHNHHVAASS
ncbi:hypothetical protein NQ176_g3048 [Zarea fungicola]|uniref:Uncharacterized protein n=1 Tax=Zarea fungicola TaxID=93591 RepID=A0ACC1NKG6_9HYPO|nr:hypothetical protein NQ176_g3048 [Lecanicillium fungicola]